MDLAAVLGQATQPGFLKTELLLHHPKRMLNLEQTLVLAVSIKSCGFRCGVSVSARRLPDRIATLNEACVPSISGLLAKP